MQPYCKKEGRKATYPLNIFNYNLLKNSDLQIIFNYFRINALHAYRGDTY